MLKVENLTFEINENGVKRGIIRDVSFELADGELLVVTGPNGGGKSTLAKVLMGVQQITSGRIFLNGNDITDYSIDERAKAGLGFAFQQPPRFKGMTIRRLIALAVGHSISDDACCDLLCRVGICAREYLDREVDGTLSGGEMKRIEIATVLAKEHTISIFDEPEAGIDLWSFSLLTQEFERLHASGKQSLMIISHQERIIRMADRILVIDGGRMAALGKREEILPTLMDSGTALVCDKIAAMEGGN